MQEKKNLIDFKKSTKKRYIYIYIYIWERMWMRRDKIKGRCIDRRKKWHYKVESGGEKRGKNEKERLVKV